MFECSILTHLLLYIVLEEVFHPGEIDFIEEELLLVEIGVGEKILDDEDYFISGERLQ